MCSKSFSVPPKAPVRALNSHHLALASYSLLGISKDTYSPFLSHTSLVVKCHLKMPALSNIKSHANSRVPVKSSHLTQLHTEGQGMPFICDLEYILCQVSHSASGHPRWKSLSQRYFVHLSYFLLPPLCLQSCSFLKPIQVNMTLFPGLLAPVTVPLLLCSAPSSPAPLRLLSPLSFPQTLLGPWVELLCSFSKSEPI